MSFAEATDADSTLTIRSAHAAHSIPLYSQQGLAAVSALYTKLCVRYRLMYQCTWLGIPIIQLPEDLLVYQELIWSIQPDVIIECGVAHGGSLVFCASMLEMLGHGRVIGVDVEIREHNRIAIEQHSLAKRITLIEGNSIAPATVEQVKAALGDARRVMVMLDSKHTTEHVYAELQAYSAFVTPGSYLVAGDGLQALVSDVPSGKAEWRDSSPLHAIERFVAENADFAIDEHCTRFGITQNVSGYLRRREAE